MSAKRMIQITALALSLIFTFTVLSMFPGFAGSNETEPREDSSDAVMSADTAETVIEHSGMVRVGMVFGSSMGKTVGFASDEDIYVGTVKKDTGYFSPCVTLPAGDYTGSISNDYFVSLTGFTDSTGETVWAAEDGDMLIAIAEMFGYNGCMGYTDRPCVCVGPFSQKAAAEEAFGLLSETMQMMGDECSLYGSVKEPGECGTVLKNQAGKTVFSFDSSDTQLSMAVKPTEQHLLYQNRTYEGIFELRRWLNNGQDGIELINVLTMEKYIACICAGEIYNSWPVGVQKAFSVVVRTYAVVNQNYHNKKYGFGLCNGTCCQHYVGDGDVSSKIRQGVEETRGEILTYDGKVCQVNYSAISGDSTAKSYEVWGGSDYPYLDAVPTPWERFDNYKPYTSCGRFTVSYTGDELYALLKNSSYLSGKMEGTIVDVKILQLATNSSHVKTIQFTDNKGNVSTIDQCSHVRMALNLVNRGCSSFVVGKAGETVTRTYYELDNFPSVVYGSGLEGIDTLPDVLNGKPVKKTVQVKLEGEEGSFVFDGCGWGHGVGMSQYGAWDMIQLGYDYTTVLAYYFPHSVISRLKLPDDDEYLPVTGDINGDRICSIADVTRLLQMLADSRIERSMSVVDLNQDGCLSIADVTILLQILSRIG